jgi:hypothetical protein
MDTRLWMIVLTSQFFLLRLVPVVVLSAGLVTGLTGCIVGEAAVYGAAVVVAVPIQAASDGVHETIQEHKRQVALEADAEGERIFQSEIAEARANQGKADESARAGKTGLSAEASMAFGRKLRVALFPMADLLDSRFDATLYDYVHQRVELSPDMDLVYSEYDERFERGRAGSEGDVWGGSFTQKNSNWPAIREGTVRVGADAAVLVVYKKRTAGWYAEEFNFSIFIEDIATDRTVTLQGTELNYKEVFDNAFSQALAYRAQVALADADMAQPYARAASVRIGILEPGFNRSTSPSNSDLGDKLHRGVLKAIRSEPTFSVSYDYAKGWSVGPSDAQSVWQGTVVNKEPDPAKVRAIASELGVDCLVLAWIRNLWARAEVDLYLYDVSLDRLHKKSGELDDVDSLASAVASACHAPT